MTCKPCLAAVHVSFDTFGWRRTVAEVLATVGRAVKVPETELVRNCGEDGLFSVGSIS